METVVFWIMVPGVYFSMGVFVLGIGWRLHRWKKARASLIPMGIFPKPPRGKIIIRVAVDSLFFPQLASVDPALWLAAILFHASLLGVICGHLHLLGEFPGTIEAGINACSAAIGGTVGIVCALAAVCLLYRRCKTPYREVSLPEDYLLLLLILGVVLTGGYLRFFAHPDLGVCQVYVRSLAAFHPDLRAVMAAPYLPSTAVHVLLVNLLLICFPFSRLVHCIGTFYTNGIRRG